MMKIIILIYSFFLFPFVFITHSQYNGKVEYKTFLNFGELVEYKSDLFFNKKKSVFFFKVKSENVYENSDDPLHIKTIEIDTTTNIIFTDISKKKLYQSHSKEKVFTYEKLPELNWILLSQTKAFNNITCSFAKTSFRGRVFYAWYAPDLPVPYGPWKLHGLPGLILEAYDEKKEVVFRFASIKIPDGYDFKTIRNRINKARKLSLMEYIQRQKKLDEEELKNRIETKLPRGVTINVEIKKNGIELNYDDILNEKN